MTKQQKTMFKAWGSVMVGVLAVAGVIWAGSARIQKIDDRSDTNQKSIMYLDRKMDKNQDEIKEYLKEIKEEVRYIRRRVTR